MKYYAVVVGRKVGVYESWEACNEQIRGYRGAHYRACRTLAEAEALLGGSMARPPAPESSASPATCVAETMPADVKCRDGVYTLFTDGASRGNPGPSGAGCVLRDPSGRTVESYAEYLGDPCTNNVAEYKAFVLGLRRAAALGVKKLEVCVDSQLLQRQVTGLYRVRDDKLLPLYLEAVDIMAARFVACSVRHVPREQNGLADAQSNRVRPGLLCVFPFRFLRGALL